MTATLNKNRRIGLKRKLSNVIIPYSAADGDGAGDASAGLEAILNSIGTEGTAAVEQVADTAGAGDPVNTTGDPIPPVNNNVNNTDKAQYAFAQMRTQNAALTNMLGKIASANGIEFANHADLMSKLNDDTINKMAQKQGVPVELLQRIETLQADSDAFKQRQLQETATAGFKQLIDDYSLDQTALMNFAKELDDDGINPFTSKVDVLSEYKTRHMDDIVNAKVQAAVQAALGRSNVADSHSSTPLDAVGGTGTGTDGAITSVQGLRDILNTVK